MEAMKDKHHVRVAWKNTGNPMSTSKLRKRPLTMQLREIAQRTRKTSFRGPKSPLYSATYPYFHIVRILGLGPYVFEDELLVPSNVYIIFTFVWICLYTRFIYSILLGFSYAAPEERGILRFVEISKAVTNYGVVIFDLFWCLISREKVVEVWNLIQDYDEILHDLGYTRKERKALIWVWSSVAVATLIFISISQTGLYAFQESWVINISYLIIYVGSAASVMKFSGLVMLVAQRFNHLNEISRKCISEQSERIIGTPEVDINIIETLHHHILSIAEKLNSAYSWSMMLWLTNLFLNSVCNLFFFCSFFIQTVYYLDLMSCYFCWSASFLTQLFFLSYVCHYASSKANCFNWIVLEWKRQLIIHNRGMKIQTSFNPMNHQFNFSAAGCFNVNLPLFCTIASSSTTYLFILLQFE